MYPCKHIVDEKMFLSFSGYKNQKWLIIKETDKIITKEETK